MRAAPGSATICFIGDSFFEPSRVGQRDVGPMVRLALSDLVSHFKFGVLGRVDPKAPTSVPSHSPIAEDAIIKGEQEVVEVSAPRLDPISPGT